MTLQEILNGEDERFYFYREQNTRHIYFRKQKITLRFSEKEYLRSIEFRYPPEGIETLEIFLNSDKIFDQEEEFSQDWIKVYENPTMLR